VSERKSNGQFKKGVSGNPNGRPRLDVEQKYLNTLRRSLLQKDVREIVTVLKEKAMRGSIQAARLLLEYAIGKPTQYVDADVTSGGDKIIFEVRYADDDPNNVAEAAP